MNKIQIETTSTHGKTKTFNSLAVKINIDVDHKKEYTCIQKNIRNEKPEIEINYNSQFVFKGDISVLKQLLEKSKESESLTGTFCANMMAQFVNTTLSKHELFIETMANKHRTLQEDFTELCFAWISHLASLNENQYDARNKYSVETSKKILQNVPEIH